MLKYSSSLTAMSYVVIGGNIGLAILSGHIMDCEHEWKYKYITDKNFGVLWAIIRVCKKCGREEANNHAVGRQGTGWIEIKNNRKDKNDQ